MLELTLPTGSAILAVQNSDYSITRKYSGVNTLHFTLSPGDPMGEALTEEALIRDTDTGQHYRIKGLRINASGAEAEARLCLDGWEASAVTSFSMKGASVSSVMTKICPMGWTVRYAAMDSRTKDMEMEYGGTPLDMALKVQELFGCAMEFDTKENICTVSYPKSGALSDTVLTAGADLREIPDYTGKSTDLVTRLYPVGAHGLTIGSVNGGKNYVENFSYTDRVICKVWKDERYEIPEHLMAAAQTMVDSLSVPDTAWEISIHDLWRQDPSRFPDHRAELGQKVQVSWGGRILSALVVEEELHPNFPEKNTLCIGSVPKTAIGSVGQLRELVEDPNSSFNAEHQAAIENATKLISGSRGGRVITVLDEDGKPMELCILSDSEDLSTAQSLWRWNEGGLGHSNTGYNGPFSLAITKDGAIVADRITVGALNAGIIKAGVLTDGKGTNFWNLETGEFSLSSAATVGGETVGGIAENAADSAVSDYDQRLNQQSVFSKLTGGGTAQGIYLSNGKLYINGSYIKTGTLAAGNVSVSGKLSTYNKEGGTLSGYLGYMSGATEAGTTSGIGVSNAAGDCYAIATSAGARLQAGDYSVYVTKTGVVKLTGNGGTVEITPNGDNGAGVYITGRLFLRSSEGAEWTTVS